jgi:hypothetical protein
LYKVIECRSQLKTILYKYDSITKISLNHVTSKEIISEIFTKWIKFILPIPDSTFGLKDQLYKLLIDLFNGYVKNYEPRAEKFIKNRNIRNRQDPLNLLILDMVYNLIPPNESICIKLNMLKKYNILSFYEESSRKPRTLVRG